MSEFYDGNRLLSMRDLNGKKPEIYICTSNRSAGKTTFFNNYVVNRFKKYGEKFMLVYRYNYELDDVADKFFKDLETIFYPGQIMVSKEEHLVSSTNSFLMKHHAVMLFHLTVLTSLKNIPICSVIHST